MLGGDDDLAQVKGLLDKLTLELETNRSELDKLCLGADEMIGAEPVEIAKLETPLSTHHDLLTETVNEAANQLETVLRLLKTYVNQADLQSARTTAKNRAEILAWQAKSEEVAAQIAGLEYKQQEVRRSMVNWLDQASQGTS